MIQSPSAVALVPARSGSKRVPLKNIRPLGPHPLLAYTIAAARESGVFESVLVSTDSKQIAEIALHYGAEVPFLRPPSISADTSPDIDFVEHALNWLRDNDRHPQCFSILRPTSPFRKAATIRRAWSEFLSDEGVDSIRAVEKVRQHPAKMWAVRGQRLLPLIPFGPEEQPWHSSQYPSLPELFVQNASLEIAWSRVVFNGRTISGHSMRPFFTQGDEGLDVNDSYDWMLAEQMLEKEDATLPQVHQDPYKIDLSKISSAYKDFGNG